MRSSSLLLVLLLLATSATSVAAQEFRSPPVAHQDTANSFPTPRGAFLRSLAVPGWGQAYTGAYTRGSIYFATQGASLYMLLRTAAKLNIAREMENEMVTAREEALLAENDDLREDPSALEELVSADPAIQDVRHLVDSRQQQREDWIAWLLFWTLARGVDAFVGAHLADFPAGVSTHRRPNGAIDLQFSIPVGKPR
jgi:hypothetical protein